MRNLQNVWIDSKDHPKVSISDLPDYEPNAQIELDEYTSFRIAAHDPAALQALARAFDEAAVRLSAALDARAARRGQRRSRCGMSDTTRPHVAEHIHLERVSGRVRIVIDGEPFPLATHLGGWHVAVDKSEFPGVTITLAAHKVTVSNSMAAACGYTDASGACWITEGLAKTDRDERGGRWLCPEHLAIATQAAS